MESKVRRQLTITKTIIASIGAHPDDVELGIGGNSGDPKGREDEAQAAAKLLNAKLHILDFPVIKLNKPSIEFESILKRTMDDINPKRLYTHSPFDYHQVHESVSECTRNAARDIQQLLYYEVISSTSPEFR